MSAEVDPRRGVLCAGTVVVDVAKVVDAFPTPEQLALITAVSTSTGGPALNLAVDLARTGPDLPLAIVGVVGRDAHAAFVRDELTRLGIDTSALRADAAAATSFTDAMVLADGGARTFFHHIGGNALLTPDDVLAALARSRARVLHLGAPGLHPRLDGDGATGQDEVTGQDGGGWVEVLAAGRAAGLHTNLELVSLAPERMRRLVRPCLPYLDSLVINEVEAARVAGVELAPAVADGPVDWPAIEAVARALLEAGVRRLVAVHHPAGAVAVTAAGEVHRQGSVRLPAALTVNATGAGDAFASGVIRGVHDGWDVGRGLRAGVCVAAACLTGAGTSDGVGPLADCLALGERYGFRGTS